MNPMQYGLKPLDHANPPAIREGLSRRGFLVSSLASGFALASGALHAQAIQTDAKGLIAGEVSIPVAGGQIPAYRAVPANAGKNGKKVPVLLVIQEIFGVHEHIKDMCRRFAKLGYYAIAPEMFARQGDVSKLNDIGEILGKVVSKVPDAQVLSDLDAAVAFAKASGQGDADRVGAVGYCWGGRAVWLYANHNPKLKAGVAYYGLLTGMKNDTIKPADPLDIGAKLAVPVLGFYAAKDTFIPQTSVEQMTAELDKGKSGSQIVVFPGVDHGFNADYRPTYDKATAEYATHLLQDWFKTHGL